ncbi:MAG: (2Fe-2S) ferredoxin domain-containing protein [Microcoleus sp.]
MVYSDNYSLGNFCLEGEFLGFASHDGKLKYIRLGMLSEEMLIKLPKAMRNAVELLLQPGEFIKVSGISKFDRHSCELKLKATQIMPLGESGTQIVPETPANPVSSVTDESKIPSKIKAKIKLLVCQKSGCLKRGGKGLCEALDRAVCDRNLEQYVSIERTKCLKRCSSAPNVVIMPGNHRYTDVRPKTVSQIVDAIAIDLD